MATTFQSQALQRKVIYIGLILVLFTVAFGWRRYVIDVQAEKLAIREQSRGEVELLGSVVRLGLTGSRGLVTCVLWHSAFEAQKKNQWNELEVIVRALTRLQPHFITPWLFQSWNLAYNVSVEADRPRDKYFYIARGVELLAQGERQNLHQPDLRFNLGFYQQQKIGKSDETNYLRSLYQLSMIPPSERDPGRFWKRNERDEPELNYEELRKFFEDHPQLVRRLREGMYKEMPGERKKLFTCDTPRDLVQFLEDNELVPSIYRITPNDVPAQSRAWVASTADRLASETERFPSLPPRHERAFDPQALTTDSTLRDDVDAYRVAHSWYAYAQEPIPAPGRLPGSTEEITDRATQRRPRHMTTLIFRNYPAQAKRFHAERLQEEGWYDSEPWDASDWFTEGPLAGQNVRIGGGPEWSRDAWEAAYQAWKEHGEANKLVFPSAVAEQNRRDAADRFARKYPMKPGGMPPDLRPDQLSEEDRQGLEAAQWLFEYTFYRQVSNFAHHLNRCFVERLPETVACRKQFFLADRASDNPRRALEIYRRKQKNAAWGGQELNPMEAWRDLVLKRNKEFRRDTMIQEQTAEVQIRYQRLENRFDGEELKARLAKAAPLLPLMPLITPETFPPPITTGPFELLDDEGVPYVPEGAFETIVDRLRLLWRRRREVQQPAASASPPGAPVPPTAPPMAPN